jgi:hypothetical protein
MRVLLCRGTRSATRESIDRIQMLKWSHELAWRPPSRARATSSLLRWTSLWTLVAPPWMQVQSAINPWGRSVPSYTNSCHWYNSGWRAEWSHFASRNAGRTDSLLRKELTEWRGDFQLVQIMLSFVIVGPQFNCCSPRLSVIWIPYETIRRCSVTVLLVLDMDAWAVSTINKDAEHAMHAYANTHHPFI